MKRKLKKTPTEFKPKEIAIWQKVKVEVQYYDKKYEAWYVQILSNLGMQYTNQLTKIK